MDNPIKLLSIVKECEFNSKNTQEKRLKSTLEKALRRWKEEVDFISFASAFEIQGRTVANAFNHLLPPDQNPLDRNLDAKSRQLIKERYAKFEELVRYPEPGKGLWPWDILRKETFGETGSFPPKVLLLNAKDEGLKIGNEEREKLSIYGTDILLEDFTRPRFEEIDFTTLANDFSQLSTLDLLTRKSWQWYAVYPSIIGEEILAIRGSKKASKVLIYLLGTRKEFARRPQNDYGLIVGLTEQVLQQQKLSEVVDAIVFAWNMLAVSPHILEDGLKIARLEAGRHTVHTVRSYITVQALPLIKFVVGKYVESDRAKELILNVTNEIATLPAMMSFVSRRPLEYIDNSTDGLRRIDLSEYNLIQVISIFFKDELEERRGFLIEIFDEINQDYYQKLYDKSQKWINELYLISALCEVISNIEKNSISGSKVKILLEIGKNSHKDEILKIKVTNYLKQHQNSTSYEYDRYKNPIHGLKSLEAFFQALGGHAYGQLDENDYTYSTIMSYNLTQWEKCLRFFSHPKYN